MKKGGYQIIDFENREFTVNVGQVFQGVYDKIEGTRKPLLISGFHYEGVEYHDFFATCNVVGDQFVIKFEAPVAVNIFIKVEDTDVVTVVAGS